MASRIPQNFIDDLLDRTDIVELVDARIGLRKSGRNYTGLCPFHQEKTPSFSVSPDKQFYYCFGCGASRIECKRDGKTAVSVIPPSPF